MDFSKVNAAASQDLLEDLNNKHYTLIKENWYSAKPYGFKISDENQKLTAVMFLPIGPNNLTINTNFATNIIPTLYGTVEEHSPVRYYDISIEGTTGMAPKYVEPVVGSPIDAQKQMKSGRSSFSISSELSLGGFFPKTLATISKTINKAADLVGGSPTTKMGVKNDNSGYVAFHNLYRFLLHHKKVSSGEIKTSGKKIPLVFFNYKDNNEYSVVVRNFTLRRSAENPMLYYYSIQMRGYNLKPVGQNLGKTDEMKDRLKNLGLDGVASSSLLGKVKEKTNIAKSIVGAVKGGFNL